MNDLTKAFLKATLYFYAIMAGPFALAWGFYFAGVNFDPLFGSIFGDKPGVATDLAALILGVLPGAFFLRSRMKANGQTIMAANEAPPFSARSLQALFLNVFMTGVLGFGVYMLLAFVFLPHMPTAMDPYFITREPGVLMGMAERLDLLQIGLPIMLCAGALFGAFMWGMTQKSLPVRAVTWAVFAASIFFNPLALMFEPAPPTLMEKSAEEIKLSPVMEEELKRMDDEIKEMGEGE
ncbi:MAG: hypothetical protein IPH06_01950 [Alphaproteobacteria bacterium]|nr:hypothetical protein [Alphaproteobacteria bacterium]QQS56815.1 MAG: hypothetical protein IPN28_11205 [Alphaproteobacteria bacterium]